MDAVEAGRALAERHAANADAVTVDRGRSLLNFSEVTWVGDWSLRSALCRLAQPEPVRVSRILESIRRLEAVLHQARQPLEQRGSMCIRLMSDSSGDGVGDKADDDADDEVYPDVRMADVARLGSGGLDFSAALVGYREYPGVVAIDPGEEAALPLLTVAVRFERLAAELARWAHQNRPERPITEFDRACDEIEAALDELGVPREQGGQGDQRPRPGGRGGRRSGG